MNRSILACITTSLALLAATPPAVAQSSTQSAQRAATTLRLGPRLLEYRIDCDHSRSCRLQCFQHGVKIFDHAEIKQGDQLHMLASTGAQDEIIPRWIEIRPADRKAARSILLSHDTACDLQSLTISTNPKP